MPDQESEADVPVLALPLSHWATSGKFLLPVLWLLSLSPEAPHGTDVCDFHNENLLSITGWRDPQASERLFPFPSTPALKGVGRGPQTLAHEAIICLPGDSGGTLYLRPGSCFRLMGGGLSGEGVPLPPSTQEMTSRFLTLGNPGFFRPSWFPSGWWAGSDSPLLQVFGSCLIPLPLSLLSHICLLVSESRESR